MKLIALKDFRNVPALRLKEDDGTSKVDDVIHDDHIHMGAIFEIGTAKTLEDLRKANAADASVVAQLIVAGCVGDANDAKVVKAVEAEVEVREGHEAAVKAANKSAADSQLKEAIRAAK